MQQVSTQGIATRAEKWSFVSLGEDSIEEANHMRYKREIIMIIKIVIFFQHKKC